MAYDYSDLIQKTKDWVQSASNAGWLQESVAQKLLDIDTGTPDTLFDHPDTRPLIVAFMGGTGVGKSSLLNRLAGQAIARSGEERPTSREVTLYHHHSVALQQLPEKLPLAKIKIATHDKDSKKNIVWIDMPDFDSTEQSNKQLVLQWLPHIDVLIYVVSPERYRDEKAWRLLLAEGGRHAWLFVLNQWDRGQAAQFEDFKMQLGKAGFNDPVIFKTVCSERSSDDEFAELEASITGLATEHTIKQLELRGLYARTQELKQKLLETQALLGPRTAKQQLQSTWQTQWQASSRLLTQGLTLPLQTLALRMAEHMPDFFTRPPHLENPLWDNWAKARFDDALDELIAGSDQLGVPVGPLKAGLNPLREKAPKIVESQCELAARDALVNPGNALHRAFLKFLRICEISLPLAAMAWVSSEVFVGFYLSNANSNTRYLGVDFAVHSVLLIALAWLIPFFMIKKSQPSLKASALRGLNKGLNTALGTIDAEVSAAIERITTEQQQQVKQLDSLLELCDSAQHGQVDPNSALARMLMNEKPDLP